MKSDFSTVTANKSNTQKKLGGKLYSPKIHAEVPAPGPVNGTLFGNKVFADIIVLR